MDRRPCMCLPFGPVGGGHYQGGAGRGRVVPLSGRVGTTEAGAGALPGRAEWVLPKLGEWVRPRLSAVNNCSVTWPAALLPTVTERIMRWE